MATGVDVLGKWWLMFSLGEFRLREAIRNFSDYGHYEDRRDVNPLEQG